MADDGFVRTRVWCEFCKIGSLKARAPRPTGFFLSRVVTRVTAARDDECRFDRGRRARGFKLIIVVLAGLGVLLTGYTDRSDVRVAAR
jgi:hypothetical protein